METLNQQKARYYDAKIGRFTGIDPWFGDISDPQSLNKYAYVRNNPLKYVDPTGEFYQELAQHLSNLSDAVGEAVSSSVNQEVNLAQNTGTEFFEETQEVSGVASEVAPVSGDINDVAIVLTGESLFSDDTYTFGERLTTGVVADVVPGVTMGAIKKADKIADAIQLRNKLFIDESLSQGGKTIAGNGSNTKIDDINRLTNQHGGNAEDWAKKVGKTREFADGTQSQVHWYENVETGNQVDPKVK